MTTIAANTYQTLFPGQTEVFLKHDENVVLSLDMSNSQETTGATFVQQVCPVTLSQENSVTSENLTELKNSEALSGGNNTRGYTCSICYKFYLTEGHLQAHLDAVHKVARRFQCSFCGKAYAKSFLLKSHVKSVHENIRDVTCTICAKAFSKRSVMRRHMKSVHAEKKDYHCTLCQKQFTEKKNLQMHINALHKGLRPYQCSSCLKEFARKCDLLRHSNSSPNRTCVPYVTKDSHKSGTLRDMLLLCIKLSSPRALSLNRNQIRSRCNKCTMGTIIAAPGTGATAMPAGAQVMMVAPGVNMPMSTFFFQPHQASPFGNQQNAVMHPTAVLPAVPTSLIPQNTIAAQTSLIQSPFGFTPVTMTQTNLGHVQPGASPNRPHKEYQCATCHKVYPRRQSLQAHIIQVHTDYETLGCMKSNNRKNIRDQTKFLAKKHCFIL
ncbi:zinc finger, C2H2 type [Opisthorchis viverrini]|uniref:Zinc finger, C2H2 type n=1 Tax=Opisthorchis viverrini TaxID=6198 RepID=A0A1S8WVR3_OPIVI|nr:zinc finger, C2H2 type [Opisthorchis viverrini]